MRILYTDEDYEQLALQATAEGKKLVKVQEEQSFEVDVPEYEKKTVQSPLTDEEGNITGYEDIEVDDLEKPIMVEKIDPETGETILIQKTHKENKTDLTERLEIVDNPENFARMFFDTSLGYVSRIVHKLDGTTEDFLNDTLPALSVGNKIITYNADMTQNRDIEVTQQFIDECRLQKHKDFYGELPNE